MSNCLICGTGKEDSLAAEDKWVKLFNRHERVKLVCPGCAYRVAKYILDSF